MATNRAGPDSLWLRALLREALAGSGSPLRGLTFPPCEEAM